MTAPDVGNTPQFEAPTLALLANMIAQRPVWAVEEPLAIDPETFEKAFNEMRDVQERRGYPVGTAGWVKRRNFLLRGVPVVMLDG